MSSLTRAVTSRLNEFTHGRQRLATEKETIPSTSEFNYFVPPEIIWEDYQPHSEESLKIEIGQDETNGLGKVVIAEKKTSPTNFSQKMTAVVRKLSPFSDEPSKSTSPTGEEAKKKAFKDTKQKMEKLKKSRRSKDRQQLIDSSDEEM